MNSLKAMYGCGLNFFIKLAYNSLFLYKFAILMRMYKELLTKLTYDYEETIDFLILGYSRDL